jgi:hypothetical protein
MSYDDDVYGGSGKIDRSEAKHLEDIDAFHAYHSMHFREPIWGFFKCVWVDSVGSDPAHTQKSVLTLHQTISWRLASVVYAYDPFSFVLVKAWASILVQFYVHACSMLAAASFDASGSIKMFMLLLLIAIIDPSIS